MSELCAECGGGWNSKYHHDGDPLAGYHMFQIVSRLGDRPDAALREAAQRLIDYLDVRQHYEDDTGIRRVDAASRPYVSDLRAALAATGTGEPDVCTFPSCSYDDDCQCATPSPALDVERLRHALRTEMGWSVYEVEDFLGQYHLATPLDEYDPQRLDGEYAALSDRETPA